MIAGPWLGWLKNYVSPQRDPNADPSFRLTGGPFDGKYVEVPKKCVEDAKDQGNPVTYVAPIQDGEVMYQESEEGVLQYVCVRFFD